MYSVILVMFS